MLSAFLCITTIASAADIKEARKGPIVITSSTLSTEGKTGPAVFEGNVVAKTGELTLHADKMTVLYTEDGKISTIEADGDVKFIKGPKVVVSERASYDASTEVITLTGEPRAVEGGNVVTGSKITYSIKDDRSVIEDSKVFLESVR